MCRGGSSRKILGAIAPGNVEEERGLGAKPPENLLIRPFLPQQNALFENRDWPFMYEKL